MQMLLRIRKAIDTALLGRREYDPGRYRVRLGLAFALSFAIHAFILSLHFGIAGFGLPGIAMPWAERRAHSSDLTARLEGGPWALLPPAPLPEPRPQDLRASATRPAQVPEAIPPALSVADPSVPAAEPTPARVELPPPAIAPKPSLPLQAPASAREAEKPQQNRQNQKSHQPEILAQTNAQQETFSVPAPTPGLAEQSPTPPVEAPPLPGENTTPPEPVAERQMEEPARDAKEQERALQKLVEEEAERRVKEQEAARQVRAREFAERQKEEEAVRQRAADAAREREADAARQQAAAERQRQTEELAERERARELAERQKAEETARQREAEAVRERESDAARQRAAAERQRQVDELAERERARELAERRQADALAAAERDRAAPAAGASPPVGKDSRPADTRPAAVPIPGRDLAAKALEQLRAPDRRADLPSRPLEDKQPDVRRGSFFGSARVDVTLRMYIDSWRAKLERSGNLYYPAAALAKGLANPLVTVVIRSDGSLKEVLINRSSGMREADEAVLRIAQQYAPYAAFPPGLARQYDVIEIRRMWSFGKTLQILEEM